MSQSELISEDLLYAECALNSCEIKIDEEATFECRHLLSLLRRKIKMTTAILVSKNANKILFSSSSTSASFIVSPDTYTDSRTRSVFREKLQHGVRGYLGVTVRMRGGIKGTLLVTSSEAKVFGGDDIYVATEVSSMIEDLYEMRREREIVNTVENISISSVLLSSIQAYLQAATHTLGEIRAVYGKILEE
eukprot:gene40718-49654_t